MTINDNKKDLRQKNYHCHKLINDIGALVMMHGKDEELKPNVATC
jgi:hypothetical protein